MNRLAGALTEAAIPCCRAGMGNLVEFPFPKQIAGATLMCKSLAFRVATNSNCNVQVPSFQRDRTTISNEQIKKPSNQLLNQKIVG